MQTLSFLLTLFATLLLILLATTVWLSSTRSAAKRWFAALCVTLVVWLSANYMADADLSSSLFWTRMTFFAITLAAASFLLFVRSFPTVSEVKHSTRVIFLTATVLISGIMWTPAFIPSVEVSGDTSNVNAGPLYWLFIVYFGGTLIAAIVWLVKKMRSERGSNRERIRLVVLGIIAMSIVGSLTNLFLPLIYNENPLARYGGFSVLLFVSLVAFAIVRHRLFSIRAVIARSLTYSLTLVTLAVSFSIIAFGIAEMIFHQSLTAEQRIVYSLLVAVVAVAYQPIKRFFDKLTRKVFFQDFYDTRDVLDELGDIAAHHMLPQSLLDMSLQQLDNVLHPSFISTLVVRNRSIKEESRIGTPVHIAQDIFHGLPPQTVIVTEEDHRTLKVHRMLESLSHDGIAVIVRLRTARETIGFVVIGYKKSGSGYTGQDLSLLSTVADELAVAVQNALRFEEISHFNEKLKQEVEDATVQLRDSNRKLKKLDEAKDEFISMASHQLRTPLTSVKGYISMVMDGDAGKLTPQQQKLLEEAFTAAQRMVYLIGDFLNVSRIQTGRFVLEPRPTDLAQVVSDEVQQLGSTAARRNITVQYHHPTQFPILTIDENKMRQVIMNFIDNAIFYSRPSTNVEVTLVNTGRDIRFEVHDSGIGVPEAERHKLFTKFFRAENARRVRPDGTGIGLFMAKKVITAHGGSILFETKEGKGSTFGFVMPIAGLKNHHE
jgi:signal transduction histidine kinase